MRLHDVLVWLAATPLATLVRENEVLFPWIEAVHVLAIALVVGIIAMVDLRLLGIAFRDEPVSARLRRCLPLVWSAFGVALISGGLMFASQAVKYAANPAFQWKMALLLLAGANMAAFHLFTQRGLPAWDQSGAPPAAVRFAGGASLALWIAIVVAGRWIGFIIAF
jgi:hypothetical protein